GLTGGVDERLIGELETLALDGHVPDLTIVLDMDPEVAFRRVEQRQLEDGLKITGDRFEKEELDWHRTLRDGFLAIANANPERCVVLDADRDEDELEQVIWATVSARFPELAAGAEA